MNNKKILKSLLSFGREKKKGMALALKCLLRICTDDTEGIGYWPGAQPRSRSMRSPVPALFIPMLTVALAQPPNKAEQERKSW